MGNQKNSKRETKNGMKNKWMDILRDKRNLWLNNMEMVAKRTFEERNCFIINGHLEKNYRTKFIKTKVDWTQQIL